MTDSGAPEAKHHRQSGAAVLIGILIAGMVAGVFILEQAGPSSPVTAAAAVEPTPSATVSAVVEATPSATAPTTISVPNSPSQSTAAVDQDKSETYAECVAYLESIGYDPKDCVDVEAMQKSASADPARDPDLPINQPPAGFSRDALDEPGIFVCSEATAPPKQPDPHATCRADRAALGMDPDVCGHPDSKVSIEVSSGVPTKNAEPVMRRPGFHIKSEFSSPGVAHPVGLQWPGGELVIVLDSTNARIGMSPAGSAATRYYAPSASDPHQRRTVAAGNYIIWVEPSDPKAPLASYSLTVGAPR